MDEKQFGNVAIKEKFNGTKSGRGHLNNKRKHILREHSEDTKNNKKHPSIDYDKTHLNSNLVDLSKPGETMNQTVNRIIKEKGIEEDNNGKIRAVAGVLSVPKDFLQDPEKLKLFEEKALEFFSSNDNLKGNVVFAQTNFDEEQPHIEFIFIPHCKETNKLDFNKMLGTEYIKTWDPVKKKQKSQRVSDGREKLSKLHDSFAEIVSKPLGLERGDGTHTTHLSNAAYQQKIKQMVNDEKTLLEKDFKNPPEPIPLPKETLFNKSEIIQLQAKEIKQLRSFIKEGRNERNLLRSAKGALKQERKTRHLARNLKKQLEEKDEKQLKFTNKLKTDLEKTKDRYSNKYKLEKELEEMKKKEAKEMDEIKQKQQKKQQEEQERLRKQAEKENEKYLESLRPKEKNTPGNSQLKFKPPTTDKDKN